MWVYSMKRWLLGVGVRWVGMKSIMTLMAQQISTENLLHGLLTLDHELYALITHEAARTPGGHPKHRNLKYAEWFASQIGPEDSVLDLGCGAGKMTALMAQATKGGVIGMEHNPQSLEAARKAYPLSNLTFTDGDLEIANLPTSDVVTLSNVLEHISRRHELLTRIREIKPRLLLIRVPQFDRDWRVGAKKDLGIDFRLDPTHVLEYTEEDLDRELSESGWRAERKTFRWGEIWARCVPA